MPSEVRIVKIMGGANGGRTPHDGRYVTEWNPHTRAGVLKITTTSDINEARRFKNGEEFDQWRAQSKVQPLRPWDNRPNRPLTAVNIESIKID